MFQARIKLFLAGLCADILSPQSNYWFASHGLRILRIHQHGMPLQYWVSTHWGIFALTPQPSTNTLTLSYSGISCSPCSYPARGLGVPVLISGMLKAPASRPVAGTFYDLVTAYVSFVRLNVHNATSNHIASNIFRAISFKNQRVSTRNSTAPTHAPPDFGCAADNGARAVRARAPCGASATFTRSSALAWRF